MTEVNRIKIIYILNSIGKSADSHFAHHLDFFNTIGKICDLFIVIESHTFKNREEKNGNCTYYYQKHPKGFLRLFELLKVFFRKYQEGYRVIYIHYSFFGCIAAILFRILFPV